MDEDNNQSIARSGGFLPTINISHISQSFATHHHYCNHERIRKRYHRKRIPIAVYTPWKRVIGFDLPGNE
jgi:hypothetical protein